MVVNGSGSGQILVMNHEVVVVVVDGISSIEVGEIEGVLPSLLLLGMMMMMMSLICSFVGNLGIVQ